MRELSRYQSNKIEKLESVDKDKDKDKEEYTYRSEGKIKIKYLNTSRHND